MNNLAQILSDYVTARDNAIARNRSNIFAAGPGAQGFSAVIDAHAARVARELPTMNLAEWEALAELVNSRLNHVRMVESISKG